MIFMYPKRVLDLYQSVYPFDTDTSINNIVKAIKGKSGGSSTRMKPSFLREDEAIKITHKTYEKACSFTAELAKKAKLPRAPKIFRHSTTPEKDGIIVYNQSKNYYNRFKIPNAPMPIQVEAHLNENQNSQSHAAVLRIISLAADILEKTNGNDAYLTVSKELLQEARLMLGGALYVE